MAVPFRTYQWVLGMVPGANVQVHLYQTFNAPFPATIWPRPDNFIEASYPGYSAVPLVNPAYVVMPDGGLFVTLPSMVWGVRRSTDPGCIVRGLYLTAVVGSADPVIVLWTAFREQKSLLQDGDWIITDASFCAHELITPPSN